MKLRLGNFITGIITLLIGALLLYFCFTFEKPAGIQSLSLIVTYPLYFVLYIGMFGCFISSIINLSVGCFSSSLVIKIISIVLLVLVVVVSIASIKSFLLFVGVAV